MLAPISIRCTASAGNLTTSGVAPGTRGLSRGGSVKNGRVEIGALESICSSISHEKVEITGKLSIEHILPQAWQSAWPLAEDTDGNRERRERLLHTFGNLTLVTPQFNTKLSNKGFPRKQKEFQRIARLLISRELETAPAWNEEAIETRAKALFEAARKQWPHPRAPKSLADVSLDFTAEASWKLRLGADEDLEEPPIDIPSARALLDRFAELRSNSQQSSEL